MPLQNRVTPFGSIESSTARGTMMGNRGGRIHDPQTQKLTTRRWTSRHWISCRLDFKNRHRVVMGAGYTELFFLDEVTALAAGHRPCFECRHHAATTFLNLHARSAGLEKRLPAGVFDRIVHADRLDEDKGKRRYQARAGSLPDGTMVFKDGECHALRDGHLLRWSHAGYGPPEPYDENLQVYVLTPAVFTGILARGYQPVWHTSAGHQQSRGGEQ